MACSARRARWRHRTSRRSATRGSETDPDASCVRATRAGTWGRADGRRLDPGHSTPSRRPGGTFPGVHPNSSSGHGDPLESEVTIRKNARTNCSFAPGTEIDDTMRTRTTLPTATLFTLGALLGWLAASGRFAQWAHAEEKPGLASTKGGA